VVAAAAYAAFSSLLVSTPTTAAATTLVAVPVVAEVVIHGATLWLRSGATTFACCTISLTRIAARLAALGRVGESLGLIEGFFTVSESKFMLAVNARKLLITLNKRHLIPHL
jgi:hypothetical protein